MTHYNRQPYSGSDTGGWRNKEWFENKVWPHVSIRFPEKVPLVLDAGCGNGRFLPWLSEIAEKVVALDPVETLHPEYEEMAEFHGVHFHEFEYPMKFDAIFFLASFMIIKKQELVNVREKCGDLLAKEGIICIYIDRRDMGLVEETFDDYTFSTCDSKTIFVEAKC